jgi:uncharacterized integral membrane protein (TIGR00697 family)
MFKIPASAIFYVLSFAISDVIAENFGFKLAVRATVLNIISQFVFCGIAAIVYTLPKELISQQASDSFNYIFHFVSLELASSIISLIIAMTLNDYLVCKLKHLFLGKGFWWRTIVSTVIGEITMLNIDYNITFLGDKTILEIQQLIFSAMIYKISAAVILAPLITMLSNVIGDRVMLLKPIMNVPTSLFSDLKNAIIFK